MNNILKQIAGDLPLKGFIAGALFWGLSGMFGGLSVALKLLFPESELAGQYLSFGRFRILHTHQVLFGFSLSVIFAAIYHSMPIMLGRPMYSKGLGVIHLFLFNIIIFFGSITIVLGISQGKEYAELEWPLDILFVFMWIIYSINFFGSIIKRHTKQFYVSIWFYIAFTVTIPVTYILNNLAIPVTIGKSYSIYSGSFDASIQWWYGHNAVAFIFTTPFLGLMYFYLPRLIGSPVYSHKLSIVHFWSLVFMYIWTGPHHLLYAPVPEWLQSAGMVFSILLVIPSWAGAGNGFLTVWKAKKKVNFDDPVLKFFLMAMFFYTMTTLEGSLLAIKPLNAGLHYTDWMIGHVHAGALGWVCSLSFAMMYILVPRLCQKALYSRELAEAHFWITLVSVIVYVASMWLSGVVESFLWSTLSYHKTSMRLIPMDWGSMAIILKIFRQFRSFSGAFFLLGFLIFLWNLWQTRKHCN